ncbi:tRNA (adenosine(37)-N6)-threonylcarbamoyltransferase complex transferase subunit TsaD [soil metagenome]
MSLILGIESTCDETAAAVVRDGWDVRSNVISSQVDLHAKYRGVVPEIASRAHIENILPVIRESLHSAACGFADIDAIAVAHRPGLVGSLLIGVTAAKTLAWTLGKPLVGVDHVQAHLYSLMLETNAPPQFPAVGLVCSGGHTALYVLQNWTDITLIGSTIDDAVGEAYDKVAAILGLGYPGGPILDRRAAIGNPKAVAFPRSRMGRESLDFSFSGLKTSVLYHVRGYQGREHAIDLNEQELNDIAASFQAACVDVIIEKIRRAVAQTGGKSVIVGGGVSANLGLRSAMTKRLNVPVFAPVLAYCTDNAAMSAGLADVMLKEERISGLDLDAITYSELKRIPR